jgi:predicted RNA-binding Zn ribbon-like protein
MDLVSYAERAAGLVNADPRSPADLAPLLEAHPEHQAALEPADVEALQAFVARLRTVFAASHDGDEAGAVRQLNDLLAEHPVLTRLDPVPGGATPRWRARVVGGRSSAAELLVTESLWALSRVVCELGAGRLGVCHAAGCQQVFVDTSPNSSRRYCSDRCSSRANVAAYRARRKAASVA